MAIFLPVIGWVEWIALCKGRELRVKQHLQVPKLPSHFSEEFEQTVMILISVCICKIAFGRELFLTLLYPNTSGFGIAPS